MTAILAIGAHQVFSAVITILYWAALILGSSGLFYVFFRASIRAVDRIRRQS